MDRKAFFRGVTKLREHITNGYWKTATYSLDELVEIVFKKENMMTKEQELQKDVTKIIKRIKELKEDETLKEKADILIDKIKKEL